MEMVWATAVYVHELLRYTMAYTVGLPVREYCLLLKLLNKKFKVDRPGFAKKLQK